MFVSLVYVYIDMSMDQVLDRLSKLELLLSSALLPSAVASPVRSGGGMIVVPAPATEPMVVLPDRHVDSSGAAMDSNNSSQRLGASHPMPDHESYGSVATVQDIILINEVRSDNSRCVDPSVHTHDDSVSHNTSISSSNNNSINASFAHRHPSSVHNHPSGTTVSMPNNNNRVVGIVPIPEDQGKVMEGSDGSTVNSNSISLSSHTRNNASAVGAHATDPSHVYNDNISVTTSNTV